MSGLRISGYASLFDRADLSGDIVRRGAFSASLLSQKSDSLPILLGHDPSRVIGIWDRAFEDATGLFVSGRINEDPKHASQIKLIKSGVLSGLSIGFRTRRARPKLRGRELFELDLFEVSVVAFPMLPAARITQIETLATPIQATRLHTA